MMNTFKKCYVLQTNMYEKYKTYMCVCVCVYQKDYTYVQFFLID